MLKIFIFMVPLVTQVYETKERHWFGSEIFHILFISCAKFWERNYVHIEYGICQHGMVSSEVVGLWVILQNERYMQYSE